ncbi:hypothetical protein ACFQDE_00880 [Deinococcus caeni]|uniref:hypothetical protein n=1 Tax=Deinococcus caeni TaxID=569127 RepID=UPI00360B8421
MKYRVSQLFLSDSGVLRTVTGSSAAQGRPRAPTTCATSSVTSPTDGRPRVRYNGA